MAENAHATHSGGLIVEVQTRGRSKQVIPYVIAICAIGYRVYPAREKGARQSRARARDEKTYAENALSPVIMPPLLGVPVVVGS